MEFFHQHIKFLFTMFLTISGQVQHLKTPQLYSLPKDCWLARWNLNKTNFTKTAQNVKQLNLFTTYGHFLVFRVQCLETPQLYSLCWLAGWKSNITNFAKVAEPSLTLLAQNVKQLKLSSISGYFLIFRVQCLETP